APSIAFTTTQVRTSLSEVGSAAGWSCWGAGALPVGNGCAPCASGREVHGARQGWAGSVAKRELVHLEYVGSPVVQRILVGRRRDVLGGQPDAEAGGVDLGERVVTPAS